MRHLGVERAQMSHKQIEGDTSRVLTINSARFMDNLIKNLALHKFCIGISSNNRVTGQIISKLSKSGIDE